MDSYEQNHGVVIASSVSTFKDEKMYEEPSLSEDFLCKQRISQRTVNSQLLHNDLALSCRKKTNTLFHPVELSDVAPVYLSDS